MAEAVHAVSNNIRIIFCIFSALSPCHRFLPAAPVAPPPTPQAESHRPSRSVITGGWSYDRRKPED
jgi:hypothetical protein